jgi:hypothetical protein
MNAERTSIRFWALAAASAETAGRSVAFISLTGNIPPAWNTELALRLIAQPRFVVANDFDDAAVRGRRGSGKPYECSVGAVCSNARRLPSGSFTTNHRVPQ